MKKVINTKFYSVKQMENMTFNLREKFKKYCSISYTVDLNAHTHAHTSSKEVSIDKRFNIYIYPKHIFFESWTELQQKYHELMR